MSMRRVIGAGISAAALLAGCARPAPGPARPPAVSSSLAAIEQPPVDVCPDGQTNCGSGSGNGVGIYTAEDGRASIGTFQLMITHFQNTSSGVTFDGRYLDSTLKQWRPLSPQGHVDAADYLGQPLVVVALAETQTRPVWRLHSPPGASPDVAVDVSGDQLADLALHISFVVTAGTEGTKTEKYVLDFDKGTLEPGKHAVVKYAMRWHDPASNAAPTPYCFAPGKLRTRAGTVTGSVPDPVVFQAQIDVSPQTGAVDHGSSANMVTLSCRQGAPATVYWWGYPYTGSAAETFYFDAGIHMKRASYCADQSYYTRAGTEIHIVDDQKLHDPASSFPPPSLEAVWTPKGALCINRDNPNNLRHPEMKFPGTCNNLPIPSCAQLASPPPPPYLADGPVNLPPLP